MVESRQSLGSIGRLKAIRLVLGFSPGSASDEIARALAPALSRALCASIEIELRPGANARAVLTELVSALEKVHAHFKRVYGREGEACRQCGHPIRRRVIGQRSSFFCAHCQR